MEIFLSDTNTYTCGRSYPEIFEYAFVILLDPVFTAALEQIRKFPDTIGYVRTAENDSNTLRVEAKIFAKKYLRKKKFRIRVDMA